MNTRKKRGEGVIQKTFFVVIVSSIISITSCFLELAMRDEGRVSKKAVEKATEEE